MKTITKNEIRNIVRELFYVQQTGDRFKQGTVNVNDVMDDRLIDFCNNVSANCDQKEADDEDHENGITLNSEAVVRALVRKFLEDS